MLTGRQIRAARAILNWSGKDLAEKTGISYPAIQRAERADDVPNMLARNLVAVQNTFGRAGIMFLNDERGVGVFQRRKIG